MGTNIALTKEYTAVSKVGVNSGFARNGRIVIVSLPTSEPLCELFCLYGYKVGMGDQNLVISTLEALCGAVHGERPNLGCVGICGMD